MNDLQVQWINRFRGEEQLKVHESNSTESTRRQMSRVRTID